MKKIFYTAFVILCVLLIVFAIHFTYNCIADQHFREIYLFSRWI